MNPVFADAGYWIAHWSRGDALHLSAIALSEEFAGRKIVTTEYVLIEVLDGFGELGEHGRNVASILVRDLQADPDVEIVPASSSLFNAALERYTNRPDKSWSLTDCASFIVMEQRGITEALAHDLDFAQAGFRALLRDDVP